MEQDEKENADWTLADLIDFEACLHADRSADPENLEERDVGFFADLPEAVRNDRRRLFLAWTRFRRTQDTETVAPGTFFPAAAKLLRTAMLFAGLLLGISGAIALLRYDGTAPVNVSGFIGLLVLGQMALLVLSVLLLFFPGRGSGWSPVGSLIRSIWAAVAIRTNRHLLERLSGEHRLQIRALAGMLGTSKSLYGHVFTWPVAGLAQWFGAAFNLAVLLTTLALVLFSDRAFGWQSAVQLEPETVHNLVQGVASPWAFVFPEGQGYPTIEQIAGSKIVLKEGIKTLTTENLVSWWPFLCLSIAVYGLIPRIVLLWVCTISGKQGLRKLTFNHTAADRLYERMTTPRFDSSGEGDEAGRLPPDVSSSAQVSISGDGKTEIRGRAFVLILEEEILQSEQIEEACKAIAARFRDPVAQVLTLGDDLEGLWKQVDDCRWKDADPRWILIREAWMPPIAETLEALRNLRARSGPQASIIVALIGPAEHETWITRPAELDRKIWTDTLTSLGDPNLRIEELADHA